MLKNVKVLVVVGVVLLFIVFMIAISISLIQPKKKAQTKPKGSPLQTINIAGNEKLTKLMRYKVSKYSFLPFMDFEATPEGTIKNGDVQQPLPAPQTYEKNKAKVIYLPLPDIFEGTVETASSIDEYRQAKKDIVIEIKKQGINTCDLNIYWVRPVKVDIKVFKLEDVRTDGC